MIIPKILLLSLFALSLSPAPPLNDSDGDGLSDKLEQELLTRFAPKFMLSANECDGLPAEFRPGSQEPQLLSKNGTVYGQVFQTVLPNKPGAFIEIHYYHLWNRDCGLNGHALDAEHVSALLSAEALVESAAAWKADYWYAAAHEDTACDASHATRSVFINAERQGPTVWISSGKHASFLNQELCKGGCGSDDCSAMNPMTISEIINLGERGAPMNGASWVESASWPLAAKMQTDFPEPVLAKLDTAELPVIIQINESQAPVKTAILVGGSTAGAMIKADQKADAALSSTGNAVETSIDKSTEGTGNSLKRAARSVWKALRGSAAKARR